MTCVQSSLQGRSRKVCVVGAGVSGLRAAALLAAAGFDVTVVEARDRIGGRIQQSPQLGLPIDVGASWIHGTRGNPVVALAEKSRRESVSLSDAAKMIDFFRQEVERRCPQAKQPEAYETLMLQIVEMWGAFMGNECKNQSLKNLWLDAGLEGDNLFVASTFQDILTDLLIPVANKATVRFGCEVTRITNSWIGVVDIEAADGFRGAFNDVIVTAPLGWLKRNEDVFSPHLAPSVSSAIRSIGYGNLDKVFIKFPRAFWNDQPSQMNGYHGDESKEIRNPWFPIESLFLRPAYAADTNPAEWRQEIISFSGLPEQFSQPVIMFFIYGQWGRHITGLIRGLKRHSKEYYRILNDNFLPYYSKLPSYNPASLDCKPLEFLSTDWQNDQFAGYGSFANQPVGSGDCSRHFDELRKGMGEDRGIWFAGEHTSPPGGLGTVTGAYWSGEEAAKRVARRYEITINV